MPHLRRGPDRHNDAVKLLCPSEIQKRADGALIAAFLVRSAGYVVADRAFPVLSLSVETIEEVFSRHVVAMKAEQIGIREREIRSGYSGFVFLTGIAR